MRADRSGPPTLLVAQTAKGGHHPLYLQAIQDVAAAAGWNVCLGMTESVAADSAMAAVAASEAVRRRIVVPDRRRRSRNWPFGSRRLVFEAFREQATLAEIHRRARLDGGAQRALVPSLDAGLYAAAVLGNPFRDTPYAGIAMRLDLHLPMEQALRRRLEKALRRRLVSRLLRQAALECLFIIDPYLMTLARTQASAASEYAKITLLPDPSAIPARPDRAEARRHLALPPNVPLILLYGVINERKGLSDFLDVLASPELGHCHALVAGEATPDAEKRLRSAAERPPYQGRLHRIARRLDSAEESLAFAASDVVWLAYRDHPHMSGVQILAAHASVSTLSYANSTIGRLATDTGTGLATSREGLVPAMRRLIEDRELREGILQRSALLSASHGPERFKAAINQWLLGRR